MRKIPSDTHRIVDVGRNLQTGQDSHHFKDKR